MSFAFVRSVLRMGAQCRQSVVPRIPNACVAESKAAAAGRTLATAVRHSWSVASAVSNSLTLATAVRHSWSVGSPWHS